MKSNRMKLFVLMILMVFVLSTLVSCSEETKSSIQVPEVKKDVYVYDQAGIIDDSVEKKLNAILTDVEKKTTVEVAVISVKSLDGYSIEEYANELFNTLGIGKKDTDNGILLFMEKETGHVRIELGRGTETYYTASQSGKDMDKYFVPFRDEGKYTEATEGTVKAICARVAKEYNIKITGVNLDVAQVEDEANSEDGLSTLEIVCAFFFILIIIGCILDKSDGGSSGSSGSYHGGSYHDYGGGGGFDGGGSFGGGCSSGGGASR